MPTYSYVCKKCEHSFEVQQSITAPELTECPKCQGEIRKVYSNVGVTFKGSGFYINDSAKPSKGSDS
jgi:putative FmdB family regulatory protein